MVQFYKLIFNIKPPENPEKWTELERKRQQKLAELEPERQQLVNQIIQDLNNYISALASTNWRQQNQLTQLLHAEGLIILHTRIHTVDIKGFPTYNGKNEQVGMRLSGLG